jgi:hypothetical protein
MCHPSPPYSRVPTKKDHQGHPSSPSLVYTIVPTSPDTTSGQSGEPTRSPSERWRVSYSLRCGASWRRGSYPRERCSRRAKRRWRCRVPRRSWCWWRRPVGIPGLLSEPSDRGVVSSGPFRSRRQTHRASGDGGLSLHGSEGRWRRSAPTPREAARPIESR